MGQAAIAYPAPRSQAAAPADTNIKNYRSQVVRSAQILNQVMRGNIEAHLQITLCANDTTSIVQDTRLSVRSVITLTPTSWHGANALPGLWFTLGDCMVTINHANSPDTDQTFNLSIIGG